jgi:membrane protein DedA with SNARE-associated domain
MNTLLLWVTHYGYIGIFSLLMFGMIGLPIPDETLLAAIGFLISKGHLSFIPAVLAAFLGSICGISISYVIGRTGGFYLIKKYGYLVRITEDKLNRAEHWFHRGGKWSLILGYFLPGIRHLTAIVAGATKLEYPSFALFAYFGGFIWTISFISLGYFFTEKWATISEHIHRDLLIVTGIGLTLLIGYWIIRKYLGVPPKKNSPAEGKP